MAPKSRRQRPPGPDQPPCFTIDLSLPPEQRYLEVCTAFKDEISNLTDLFDQVVGDMVPFIPVRWLHRLGRLLLRRVYSSEENAELKGISKVTGVSMYLLICFNVLLDLLMGCSSGGAAVRAGRDAKDGSKMVHFRTLDWGMDELRRIVVQLDYVLEKNGPVVASSITYVGFVGVLTGVRERLSLSLNFRPNRIDNGKRWSDFKYAWHLLMVLLGRRRSISSDLRRFLLPRKTFSRTASENESAFVYSTYGEIVAELAGNDESKRQPITTTACYLCICNGQETTIIEKDRISAKSRSSTDFIIVTNSDAENENTSTEKRNDVITGDVSMQEIIKEAEDRRECASNNWSNMCFRRLKPRSKNGLIVNVTPEERRALMKVEDVVDLVQYYPTTNECSHYACVMDPSRGRIEWCRRWLQPVNEEWIEDHVPARPP